MLLGEPARKAARGFLFQAEFYMPSFLNPKADIYQMSRRVPKESFQRHSENTVLVKEWFPAFRKPLALVNSFHHKFIPSHF